MSAHVRDAVRSKLVSDFERDLFDAALRNLDDTSNPLRFNNFAYATRELIRHILRRLAPDDAVLKCCWYKNETKQPSGISRRQRVFYAVQGGLADSYVSGQLGLEVDVIHRPLRDAIDELSKLTHIEEQSFLIPEADGSRAVADTLDALANLFQAIKDCRQTLGEALVDHLDRSVVDTVLDETIDEIDELATHHYIEEVLTEEVEVTKIDHSLVHFSVGGTVSVELQWGSNSDVQKGDGAVLPQGFPFTCELSSPVTDPTDVSAVEGTLRVDTRSWHDHHEDQDQ